MPLSKLAKCWTRFPQLVANVKVREKIPFEQFDGVLNWSTSRAELKSAGGRVLLRYSGTEPKARLLLEGRDARVFEKVVAENHWRDPETDRGVSLTIQRRDAEDAENRRAFSLTADGHG